MTSTRKTALVVGLAGIAIAGEAYLPWFRIEATGVPGISEGLSGEFNVILGAVVAVWAAIIFWKGRWPPVWMRMPFPLLFLVVGLVTFVNPFVDVMGDKGWTGTGYGFWLTLLTAITGLTISIVWLAWSPPQEQAV